VFAGQTSGGAADLTGIATLITQIGLSAIFLWLWWTERKERQEQQQTLLKLMERALPALAESTDALDRVQTALTSQVDRGQPDHRAADLAIRRLELMADELGSTMRQARRRKEDFDNEP
jgi:hypothetical protein